MGLSPTTNWITFVTPDTTQGRISYAINPDYTLGTKYTLNQISGSEYVVTTGTTDYAY
jgi:hypothetical protein